MILEKAIPNELTDVEYSLYESLWFLKWAHDVFFEMYGEYDEYFQEGEYTVCNKEKWEDDWVGYDTNSLFMLYCEVYDYLYSDEDSSFKSFANAFLEDFDLPNAFFIYLEERK